MRKVITLGKRSSLASAMIAATYATLQILVRIRIIPEPASLFWFLVPSFLLAPVFLITMICIDLTAPTESRRWTTIAWILGTINCTMITIAYFSQLAHVNPSAFNRDKSVLILPMFHNHTFIDWVKYTGWFLMGSSTFISAFNFKNNKTKQFYSYLFDGGILLLILIISWFYPSGYFLNFIWMYALSLTMFQTSLFFNKEEKALVRKEKRMKYPAEWFILN